MKIKSYTKFGDNDEYVDIEFVTEKNDMIKVSINTKTDRITIDCEDADISDLIEVIDVIKTCKLEIEL